MLISTFTASSCDHHDTLSLGRRSCLPSLICGAVGPRLEPQHCTCQALSNLTVRPGHACLGMVQGRDTRWGDHKWDPGCIKHSLAVGCWANLVRGLCCCPSQGAPSEEDGRGQHHRQHQYNSACQAPCSSCKRQPGACQQATRGQTAMLAAGFCHRVQDSRLQQRAAVSEGAEMDTGQGDPGGLVGWQQAPAIGPARLESEPCEGFPGGARRAAGGAVKGAWPGQACSCSVRGRTAMLLFPAVAKPPHSPAARGVSMLPGGRAGASSQHGCR